MDSHIGFSFDVQYWSLPIGLDQFYYLRDASQRGY